MYGANLSLCTLMTELRDLYHIKPVLLLRSKGPICDFCEKEGITYVLSHFYWWVNYNHGIFQFFLNIRKQFRNLIRVKKWRKLFQQERFDLIYTNSITINVGFLLGRGMKIPHIWHVREGINQFPFKLSLGKIISRMILRIGAEKYILVSDFLTRNYQYMLPPDKVIKVHNGISSVPSGRKTNQINKVLDLCVSGIISEQKNQKDAVKAVHYLVSHYKIDNICLHVVGGEVTAYKKELENYVAEHFLQQYVVFHGYLSDIHELMDHMNLGLMCSHDEAFGRATIEYMLHRMPVIASNSGANPELVNEGTCGYLYNIYHPEDLAFRIKYFIDNPHLLQSMGDSAFAHAMENFSSVKNTRSIYQIISEVVNEL